MRSNKNTKVCTDCIYCDTLRKDLIHNETGEVILKQGTPICAMKDWIISEPRYTCPLFNLKDVSHIVREISKEVERKIFAIAIPADTCPCTFCVYHGPFCSGITDIPVCDLGFAKLYPEQYLPTFYMDYDINAELFETK